MYIAFKWLLCLSLLMWIGICFVELIHKRSKDIVEQGILAKTDVNHAHSTSYDHYIVADLNSP